MGSIPIARSINPDALGIYDRHMQAEKWVKDIVVERVQRLKVMIDHVNQGVFTDSFLTSPVGVHYGGILGRKPSWSTQSWKRLWPNRTPFQTS